MPRLKSTLAETWRFRSTERAVLALSFLAFMALYLSVSSREARPPGAVWEEWLPALVYLGAIIFLHLGLVLARFRGDCLLTPAAMFLAGLGVLIQHRMEVFTAPDPYRLASWSFPAGILIMFAAAILFRRGRHRVLAALGPLCALLAAALLGAIAFVGQRYRGAIFMPGNTNPSDTVKILLVIFAAGFFTAWRERGRGAGVSGAAAFLLLWSVPMALLVYQRDLGMLALLNATLLALLAAATGRIQYALLGMAGVAAMGALVYFFSSHSQARFASWLAPFADPTGKSWQILQALSAMYSGGLWGVGLGRGAPGFIPIASSDFIYAVIGEELGYIGCGIALAFYLALFLRGYLIANNAPDQFGRLLATGLATVLAFQTILNVGGVVKALPLTGITLPLVSRGGSSFMATCLAVGLLLAISDSGDSGRKARSGRGRKV